MRGPRGRTRGGYSGRPLLVFPSAEHSRYEWEEHEMADAVRDLIDAGRVTLHCIDAAGVSIGAYHAANLTWRHPHRFPLALCFSGVYDSDFTIPPTTCGGSTARARRRFGS